MQLSFLENELGATHLTTYREARGRRDVLYGEAKSSDPPPLAKDRSRRSRTESTQ